MLIHLLPSFSRRPVSLIWSETRRVTSRIASLGLESKHTAITDDAVRVTFSRFILLLVQMEQTGSLQVKYVKE